MKFVTIIDVRRGVNSYILHQRYKETQKLTRFVFDIKPLTNRLIHFHMVRRLEAVRNMPGELIFSIKRILKIKDEAVDVIECFEIQKNLMKYPPMLKRTKYPCLNSNFHGMWKIAENVSGKASKIEN